MLPTDSACVAVASMSCLASRYRPTRDRIRAFRWGNVGSSAIASSKRPRTANAHARPLCENRGSIARAREYHPSARSAVAHRQIRVSQTVERARLPWRYPAVGFELGNGFRVSSRVEQGISVQIVCTRRGRQRPCSRGGYRQQLVGILERTERQVQSKTHDVRLVSVRKGVDELIEQARGLHEVPIVTGQHDLKNQALPFAEPVSHRRGFAQVVAPGDGTAPRTTHGGEFEIGVREVRVDRNGLVEQPLRVVISAVDSRVAALRIQPVGLERCRRDIGDAAHIRGATESDSVARIRADS